MGTPWAGPPRLLIAATVLGFAVSPMLSSAGEDGDPGRGAGAVRLSSVTGSAPLTSSGDAARRAAAPVASAPEEVAATPARKVRVPRRVIGVVTFNQYRKLTTAQALRDARTITRNRAADIVGWQEAWDSGPVFADLRTRGWATKRFPRGAQELAVSWRQADFAFVGADQRQVAKGVDDGRGRYPFGDRWALRVTLRDRASGELISVLNTHLPQAIEDLDRPGRWRPTYNSARARAQLTRLARMWDRAPGRWVVGTGDYNVDAGAESKVRPQGGLSRMFAGRAVSSYSVLGLKGLGDTHPVSGRHIDYVHAARKAVRQGRLEFQDQWTIPRLSSDHRPLLARIKLG